MADRVTILQGHPDPAGGRFCHALAAAYSEGARAAGREVKLVEVAKLDFPLLRTAADFYDGAGPEGVRAAQEAILWADHLMIVYPLWFGCFPAQFHAFFEQAFRPGFALERAEGRSPKKLFVGKSARVVVTMGMPGWFYRWYFRAHSLKSLERNILGLTGVGPIRATLIGSVGSGAVGSAFDRDFPTSASAAARQRWLDRMRALGHEGR